MFNVLGSAKVVGREQGWLCLLYVRIHGEDRDLPQRADTTDIHVFQKDRASSRADEGREKRRSVTGIAGERHDAFLVSADVRSQYVITILAIQ